MPKIALSKIFRVWQSPTVGSLKWGDNISSRPPTKICSNPTQGCVFFIGNPLKPFILLQMNCGIVIPCKETEQERQIPSDNDSASLYFGLMTPPRTDKVSYHHSSVAITMKGPIWLLWILQQWHWGSHAFCSAQGPPGAKRRFPTLLWAYNQNWLHLLSLLCDHHRKVRRVLDLDIWFQELKSYQLYRLTQLLNPGYPLILEMPQDIPPNFQMVLWHEDMRLSHTYCVISASPM